MRAFRFQALTTEEWLEFLERELPGAAARVDAAAYLHAPGLPASAPRADSAAAAIGCSRCRPACPTLAKGARLTPLEWRLYLDHMPRPTPAGACAELDARFALGRSENAEILSGWLELALESGYAPALPRALAFLGEVGRMKYLKPLYKALLAAPGTRSAAREAYARYRDGYHPIARHVIESLFGATGA